MYYGNSLNAAKEDISNVSYSISRNFVSIWIRGNFDLVIAVVDLSTIFLWKSIYQTDWKIITCYFQQPRCYLPKLPQRNSPPPSENQSL